MPLHPFYVRFVSTSIGEGPAAEGGSRSRVSPERSGRNPSRARDHGTNSAITAAKIAIRRGAESERPYPCARDGLALIRVLARQLPHAIADSAHRLNDSGAVAELFAERTDEDVHNVAAAGVAVSPDVFKE
jgi:hypothetical protein